LRKLRELIVLLVVFSYAVGLLVFLIGHGLSNTPLQHGNFARSIKNERSFNDEGKQQEPEASEETAGEP
jgi:hypothetical protein